MKAILQITQKCNMNCVYCFEGNKTNESLDIDRGIKAIDFIINNLHRENDRELGILFYGGEPLLEFSLLEFLICYLETKLKNSNIKTNYSIITNGTLLNDNHIEFFKKYRDKFMMKVSMDGKKETHDKQRITVDNQGTFDQVFKNSKLLQPLCDDFIIAMVVTPTSVTGLYENVLYLIENGFRKVEFEIDMYNSVWTEETFFEYQKQVNKLIKFYYPEIISGSDLEIVTLDNWVHSVVIERNNFKKCGAGKDSFYINIYGDIYSCPLGDQCQSCYLGNIDSGFTKNFLNEDLDYNKFPKDCYECANSKNCILECLANNTRLTGKIYGISPIQCTYSKLKTNTGTYLGNLIYQKDSRLFYQRYVADLEKHTKEKLA